MTDVVTKWPAYKNWSEDYLKKICKEKRFEAGPVNITMEEIYQIFASITEDKPLYIFDKSK
eukprot:Pgem_evm1s16329